MKKTLKEILEQLKGTDYENIIQEVNDAVDTTIFRKTKAAEDKAKALEMKLKDIEDKTSASENEKIAKELIGNDEKKIKLLLKNTDLKDKKDEKEKKEAMQETIKEYDWVFAKKDDDINDEQKDEEEVEEFKVDPTVEEKQNISPKGDSKKIPEGVSEALTEDK